MKHCTIVGLSFASLLLSAGCRQNNVSSPDTAWPRSAVATENARIDSCALALAPHSGDSRIDQEIVRLQAAFRTARDSDRALEQLGWALVAKARESFDPGYYRLVEQCALCLDSRHPAGPEAMLLRGHALHNLHRFQEAEAPARDLAARRGLPCDFGLLGDVLMEQGRLKEAAAAYQQMLDLRPDLHSYARGAHLRWLKGDLDGALELMQMAADAGSPQDPDSAAWVNTRLAFYHFQAAGFGLARQACDTALAFQANYAPALLWRGRLKMAAGDDAAALADLRRAAELNPLPEYQWTLAEACREAGRVDEALVVESELRRKGTATDPRTCSLYLATRHESVETALRLAREELKNRADVFTHDALAWALAASERFARELGSELRAVGLEV